MYRKVLRLLPLFGLSLLSVTANTVIFSRIALAADVNWGDWTPLDDKAQKGIDWRKAQGQTAGTNGLFEWNYQFRNRYPKKIKFQSTATYEDKNGNLVTDTKTWILNPQETDGTTLNCKRLLTVDVSKPEVVKATTAVPNPPAEPVAPAPVTPAPVTPAPMTPDPVVPPAVEPVAVAKIDTQKSALPVPQDSADERLKQAEARIREAEARAKEAEARAKEAEARERIANAKPDPKATVVSLPNTSQETGAAVSPPLRTLSGAAWRLAAQSPITAHSNPVAALAYSPDGSLVASCSWRQNNGVQVSEILLEDATTGQTVRRLEGRWETEWNGKGPKPPWLGHWGKVNDVAFSPNGATLASCGEDGRVTLWDVKTGRATKALSKMERPVIALSWVAPRTLCGLSRDGKVATWNLTTNRVATLPLGNLNSGDWVRVGTFSNDGQLLATGDGNGGLCVWNIPGGALARKLNNSLYQDLQQPQGVELTAIAFSPDNKLILSANQAHVYLNPTDKSADAGAGYSNKLLFAGQRVRQVVFAPDGQTAVAVCDNKAIVMNPLAKNGTDARIGDLPPNSSSIVRIAVSPRQDAFVSGGPQGNVVMWR